MFLSRNLESFSTEIWRVSLQKSGEFFFQKVGVSLKKLFSILTWRESFSSENWRSFSRNLKNFSPEIWKVSLQKSVEFLPRNLQSISEEMWGASLQKSGEFFSWNQESFSAGIWTFVLSESGEFLLRDQENMTPGICSFVKRISPGNLRDFFPEILIDSLQE